MKSIPYYYLWISSIFTVKCIYNKSLIEFERYKGESNEI